MWRQGDVYLDQVESIPSGALRLPHCVLAEGEVTGHSHRIEALGVAELLEAREGRFLRVLADEATLVHQDGCSSLHHLPDGLEVSGWLDLTGTRIATLPDSLQGVQLRWRNVFVDERIVFRPETITAEEVLAELNSERRRVLLERMGNERFFEQSKAEVIDRDQDAGGERRLLQVPLVGDEALVCIAVLCPSTGRQYLIRVPPRTPTCRHAAAWIAGFDDPDDYRPTVET